MCTIAARKCPLNNTLPVTVADIPVLRPLNPLTFWYCVLLPTTTVIVPPVLSFSVKLLVPRVPIVPFRVVGELDGVSVGTMILVGGTAVGEIADWAISVA